MNNDQHFPNHIAPEHVGRELLSPHFGRIDNSIRKGFLEWKRFEEALPRHRLGITTRTQACFINDMVVEAVKVEFANLPGVYLRSSLEFLVVEFQGKIVLRFKKLDRESLPVNYPTKQQQALHAQQCLSNMPPATWVTAGYKLTPLGDEIKAITCLCQYKQQTVWRLPVSGGGAAARDLFPITDPQAPDQDRPTVRPKRFPKRETNEG